MSVKVRLVSLSEEKNGVGRVVVIAEEPAWQLLSVCVSFLVCLEKNLKVILKSPQQVNSL